MEDQPNIGLTEVGTIIFYGPHPSTPRYEPHVIVFDVQQKLPEPHVIVFDMESFAPLISEGNK
jgi:hypothetical protein